MPNYANPSLSHIAQIFGKKVQQEPSNASNMVIEGIDDKPAANPNLPIAAPAPELHSPHPMGPQYLLNHDNDFDPNVYTPQNMIDKGILRGLDPVKKT